MTQQWYIIHAHSGFENKVAGAIKERAVQHNMVDRITEVVVPTEEVVEVRRGKKVATERKFFPGYVLVKMDLNDAAWQLVKHTPKVTGFLGGGNKPQALSDAEVNNIFKRVEEGAESPRSRMSFETGEEVKVIDGPFAEFTGSVEEVDDEKQRLKVSVSIFGRATPVELEFSQVQKVTK